MPMTARGRCCGHSFREDRVGSPCLEGGGGWKVTLSWRCMVQRLQVSVILFGGGEGGGYGPDGLLIQPIPSPPFLLSPTCSPEGLPIQPISPVPSHSLPSPTLPPRKSDPAVLSRWTDHNLSFSCHLPLGRLTIPLTLSRVTIPLHLEKVHGKRTSGWTREEWWPYVPLFLG